MRNAHSALWAEAFDLIERAERLNRQFFRFAGAESRRPRWEPPVDLMETATGLYLVVALPGVEPAAVEIIVEPTALTVRAVRPMPKPVGAGLIRRLEIPYGAFERRLSLPGGPYVVERHEFCNGCLIIALQQRPETP